MQSQSQHLPIDAVRALCTRFGLTAIYVTGFDSWKVYVPAVDARFPAGTDVPAAVTEEQALRNAVDTLALRSYDRPQLVDELLEALCD